MEYYFQKKSMNLSHGWLIYQNLFIEAQFHKCVNHLTFQSFFRECAVDQFFMISVSKTSFDELKIPWNVYPTKKSMKFWHQIKSNWHRKHRNVVIIFWSQAFLWCRDVWSSRQKEKLEVAKGISVVIDKPSSLFRRGGGAVEQDVLLDNHKKIILMLLRFINGAGWRKVDRGLKYWLNPSSTS